jgi:DNA-binding response OmpR family regulator
MLIRIDEPAIPNQKADFTLLYVGRDVDWFGHLKGVLDLPQYRVVYCPGGSSAELLLKSDVRYDLFVFDFDLPNETGGELIRLARSLSHRERTPIIIVANEVTGSLKALVRSVGAGECVDKTSDVLVVMETIERRLAKARRKWRSGQDSNPGFSRVTRAGELCVDYRTRFLGEISDELILGVDQDKLGYDWAIGEFEAHDDYFFAGFD